MRFSRLVPLRLAIDIEPCLVCGGGTLQAGFLLIKISQIARGIHHADIQLA